MKGKADYESEISILELKTQRLINHNNTLQATIDGLTQFICASAMQTDFGTITVSKTALAGEYKATWSSTEHAISIDVEEVL